MIVQFLHLRVYENGIFLTDDRNSNNGSCKKVQITMKLNTQRKRSIVTLAASRTLFANRIVPFRVSLNFSLYPERVIK